MGGFLISVGLIIFGCGLIALIRGRMEWARIRSRKAAGLIIGGAIVITGVGGALSPVRDTPTHASDAATAATTTTTSATPVSPSTSSQVSTPALPPSSAAPVLISPTSASPATTAELTANEVCDREPWPLQLPDVQGLDFNTASTDTLFCFNLTVATAPDGHDVMNDPANSTYEWFISNESPQPGTPMDRSTPVTLQLRRESH
ncbi:hypothetical protein [Rhodococcus koreensis]|uniref:hypothetical protein n=1 Tax=Rhodococcus koreensis TaxID=99653 RepID=UPI00198097B3|nr:hypothetical protein [Rhodococcus koreensis]QSE86574.1 hypothetical protein JWS14_46635 [Rhodococcus koreensis]